MFPVTLLVLSVNWQGGCFDSRLLGGVTVKSVPKEKATAYSEAEAREGATPVAVAVTKEW